MKCYNREALHGAKADSWFSHIAVEVPGEETATEWCEQVEDINYYTLPNRKEIAR